MFQLISGRAKIVYMPKTATTAFSNGAIVASTSGYLVAATSSTTAHIGVIMRSVVSTDSDYALTSMVPVMVFSPEAIFEGDATGLTAALVNTAMDLTDSVTVAGATNTHHQVILKRFITATKGWFSINSSVDYSDIV